MILEDEFPTFSDDQFPTLSEKVYQWAPLYLEPVPGSGERITIAVAAKCENEVKVIRVLQDRSIKCLLGKAQPRFSNLAEMVRTSVEEHLMNGGALTDWQPLFAGAYAGHIHETFAESENEVLRTAMTMSSAFSALAEFDSEPENEAELPAADRVIQLMKSRQPVLAGYFNKKYKIREHAKTMKVAYAGQHYAANISSVLPARGMPMQVAFAEARILEMASLREHDLNHGLDSLGGIRRLSYELLLFRPEDDSPLFTNKQIDTLHENLEFLEDIGDKVNIQVVPLTRPELAVDRIIRKEAA